MRVLLAKAGVLDEAAQDTAIRVLVVHAIGDAAVAAGPEGSGPLDLDVLRASYAVGPAVVAPRCAGALVSSKCGYTPHFVLTSAERTYRWTAPNRSPASATARSRAAPASSRVSVRSGARKRRAKASERRPSPTWAPL